MLTQMRPHRHCDERHCPCQHCWALLRGGGGRREVWTNARAELQALAGP
jgi:hypothetical protein